MKKLYGLLLIFLVAFTSGRFSRVSSIAARPAFFTTDNMGNLYLVTNNVLEKYDGNGKLLNSFSDKKLDELTLVDASNPLKVMVYNKTFSILVFLDNTLSINSDPLQLERMGLNNTRLVCASHDNGIWIYDDQNSELVRAERPFEKTQRSGNISATLGYKPTPNFLLEYNNLVYLNNPETGILVFDIFGAYYKTIPLKNLVSFQLRDQEIIYFQDKKIKTYNTKLLEENTSMLPDTATSFARIENGRLYILKPDTVSIYSTK